MKTVSLELAKQLKEAGYPQLVSDRKWRKVDDLTKIKRDEYKDKVIDGYILNIYAYNYLLDPSFDSPTADEILDQLPKRPTKDEWRLLITKNMFGEWHINYNSQHHNEVHIEDESLADAAAKMWLYLKKNGLLEVPSKV